MYHTILIMLKTGILLVPEVDSALASTSLQLLLLASPNLGYTSLGPPGRAVYGWLPRPFLTRYGRVGDAQFPSLCCGVHHAEPYHGSHCQLSLVSPGSVKFAFCMSLALAGCIVYSMKQKLDLH